MATSTSAVCRGKNLFAADCADDFKAGDRVMLKITRHRGRSLKHMRLYWSLIGLAMDYWEPKGGLISGAERKTVMAFGRWIDRQAGGGCVGTTSAAIFLDDMQEARCGKINAVEASTKQFSDWVKMESGWCDRIETPSGVKVVPRSISFSSSSQDEFNDFYKRAFSVVWNFVLSHHFESEQAAIDAVDELGRMA